MKTLQDYMDKAQELTFKKHGAFFAFSQKQFDARKVSGVVYLDLGAGLVCPKENCMSLLKELEQVYNTSLEQHVKENSAEDIIRHEYFNHESQVTMDNTAALSALQPYVERFPDKFTSEKICRVFESCKALAILNDWF